MDGELNGRGVAGEDELSPLDYLLSVMDDAGAMPELRIKAAQIAAPYLHSPPQPGKMQIVIEDPYGFDFDPALARELRDNEAKLEVMFRTQHMRPGEDHAQKEHEVMLRIAELKKMLPECPAGYRWPDANKDMRWLRELDNMRKMRHKLNKEEHAEEAHLTARVATFEKFYNASPEGRGRERISELRSRQAFRQTLSEAERQELEELRKLYPDPPHVPDRVERAMLDYIEKCDREEAQRAAARRAQ